MESRELVDLRRSLTQFRRSIEGLRSRHGATPAVRRLANDVDRLEIDIAECAELESVPPPRDEVRGKHQVVVMSDDPYDKSLWHDVDDEGVGGRRDR